MLRLILVFEEIWLFCGLLHSHLKLHTASVYSYNAKFLKTTQGYLVKKTNNKNKIS